MVFPVNVLCILIIRKPLISTLINHASQSSNIIFSGEGAGFELDIFSGHRPEINIRYKFLTSRIFQWTLNDSFINESFDFKGLESQFMTYIHIVRWSLHAKKLVVSKGTPRFVVFKR